LIKNLVDVAQKCPSDKVAIKLTFTLKPTNKKKKRKRAADCCHTFNAHAKLIELYLINMTQQWTT